MRSIAESSTTSPTFSQTPVSLQAHTDPPTDPPTDPASKARGYTPLQRRAIANLTSAKLQEAMERGLGTPYREQPLLVAKAREVQSKEMESPASPSSHIGSSDDRRHVPERNISTRRPKSPLEAPTCDQDGQERRPKSPPRSSAPQFIVLRAAAPEERVGSPSLWPAPLNVRKKSAAGGGA